MRMTITMALATIAITGLFSCAGKNAVADYETMLASNTEKIEKAIKDIKTATDYSQVSACIRELHAWAKTSRETFDARYRDVAGDPEAIANLAAKTPEALARYKSTMSELNARVGNFAIDGARRDASIRDLATEDLSYIGDAIAYMLR